MCANQTPKYPLPIPMPKCSRRGGISANCNGTTNKATTKAISNVSPGNSIYASAYAAKAAITIGMIVAGMVTVSVLKNALAILSWP